MEAQNRPACKLLGTDGNVFAIMGKVSRTLKQAGLKDKADEFLKKAQACGSYDEVLGLLEDFVEVE